jgi:general secretion pathway protein M
MANRKAAVLVGLTLALPLFLLVSLSVDLLLTRQEYAQQIERLDPRIARLRGLVKTEKKLQRAYKKAEAGLEELTYSTGQNSDAVATAMQKNVRAIISAAGLSVANSQVLPVKEAEGFDEIRLKLTIKGDISALDAALMQLTNYRPLLLIESTEIWPDRRARRRNVDVPEQQQLTASLQLLSLRPLL